MEILPRLLIIVSNCTRRIEVYALLDEFGNCLETAEDVQELAEDITNVLNAEIDFITGIKEKLESKPNKYYVSECPDTNRQFLVETGKDGNIIELTSNNVSAMALLEFLRTSYNEYQADVLPLYPSDSVLTSFGEFDEVKNEFLENLWDVIQQHFDDD